MPKSKHTQIVAFSPGQKLTEEGIIEFVKSQVAHHKGALVLVLPESVFDMTAISRREGKLLAGRINKILQTHGNAYVFMSVIESRKTPTRQTISNTGYIITPSRKNPWKVYPKVSTYGPNTPKSKRLQPYDHVILQHNVNNQFETHSSLIKHWLKRAKKVRTFPTVKINGKRTQLRVCADTNLENLPEKLKTKQKADTIIVPSMNLITRHNTIRRLLATTGAKSAIFVDGHWGVSHYSKKRVHEINGITHFPKAGITIRRHPITKRR
ncbi:MAG: hypothetical protein WCW13_06865 [archaeon]|jgi:hypothetical protein